MFHSARLKLTAWYLLIIMTVSIAFSAVIYFGATGEIDRVLRLQKFHIEHPEYQIRVFGGRIVQLEQIDSPLAPDPQVLENAEVRIFERLVGVNLIILVVSAIAGYFLAGRTLRPIKQMVDDQNRFITDASHELNTPLTSLRTAIEVNLRNKKLSLEKAKEVLQSNLEEVETLQLLSSDLIKLTQYQHINGNMPFTNVSLQKVIAAAVEKVTVLAKSKKIEIISDVSALSIKGDERSLIETFVVLLDNAIKYSFGSSVVRIVAKKSEGKAQVQVIDNGMGIEEKDLPHIFDRFYRADKSRTKQTVPGYGLGLSIAKRVVAFHNGSIVAVSEIGEGTTFTLLFPVAKKN
jgi:signal transduction histidine kinase